MTKRGTGLLFLAMAASITGQSDAALPDHGDAASSVSALFQQWDRPAAPGCAVSVVRDQKLLLSKAYGQAIVEAGRANTPDTEFHLASVSKQFTAFAIHLLAKEGRLSLDDDARKYVPELHDFSRPVTIRHLLHHTSGIRDQWELLSLAGRRQEDTITQDDVLRVIFGQRELNFAPGSRFSYSNSNYTLLALIVERVSGQRFADFLAKRVFEPLGMAHSYVNDTIRPLRQDQAWPYAPGEKGVERRYLPYSNYGATDVRSSAADMARWAMNLDKPKVGNSAMIARMFETANVPGRPASHYASGFLVGTYRGTRVVEHGGSDAGYVAHILTLPDKHFAATILCNSEWGGSGAAHPADRGHLSRWRARPGDKATGSPAQPEPACFLRGRLQDGRRLPFHDRPSRRKASHARRRRNAPHREPDIRPAQCAGPVQLRRERRGAFHPAGDP